MNTKNIKSIFRYSIMCLFVCFFFNGCTNVNLPTGSIPSSSNAPVTTIPTNNPTDTLLPTNEASNEPTINPTKSPMVTPTATNDTVTKPTLSPTLVPTKNPTITPVTKVPTKVPTLAPSTKVPTKTPTITPTTKVPTKAPTKTPTKPPTKAPVKIPTINKVTSPGKTIFTNPDKTVTVDISNASDGYFSVKYSGSNSKVKTIVTKGDVSYTYDINTKNTYIYYPLQLGNGAYNIAIYENIGGKSYMQILNESFSAKIINENSPYLYPNQYVWYEQNSAITKLSANVCAGCESDVEKVSAIFKYVTSNISYDYNKAKTVTSGYLPNIDNILASKKGICFDYASVFAAMCRAQGLPCKLVTGYVPDDGDMAFHAWNLIYTKEKGYITVSFYIKPGYNTLDPTFYSTINDDKKAAAKFGDGSQYQVYKFY